MTDDPVIFERYSEEVTACILNRPEKRNALSIELMQRLCVFSEQIRGDAKTRIWILRGKGSAFCSGLDFNEVMHPELGVESAKMVKQCLLAIHQAPVMTIAMVHGAARGGGGGLVAA
jgi:methylglutaconyl-CoA hydratase